MKLIDHVFYNNQTGEIYFIKKLTHKQAENNCRLNSAFNMSCVPQSTLSPFINKKSQKINLSTMTLEPRNVPEPTLQQQVREKRNAYLKSSDWTQVPDGPFTDAQRAEWATYRQQLRDMPIDTYVTASDVVWPTRP